MKDERDTLDTLEVSRGFTVAGSIFSIVFRLEIMYLEPVYLFTNTILFKFFSFLAILSFLLWRAFFFESSYFSYSSARASASLDFANCSISVLSSYSLKISKNPPFLAFLGFLTFSFFSNYALFFDLDATGASSSPDSPNSSCSGSYSPKMPPPSDSGSESSSLILRPSLASVSYCTRSCFFTIL